MDREEAQKGAGVMGSGGQRSATLPQAASTVAVRGVWGGWLENSRVSRVPSKLPWPVLGGCCGHLPGGGLINIGELAAPQASD